MENNKMSINRALAELKLLDKRINEKTSSSKFMTYYIGKKPPTGYKSNEEFNKEAASNLQSIKDLIKRRNAIKAAIIKSNAETYVNIAGKTMTVAEAIDRKDSINYEKSLLFKLRNDYGNVSGTYDALLQNMNNKIDAEIKDLNTKDSKATEDERKDAENHVKSRYEPFILDPIDVKKQIELLVEEISNFEMEVDFVLTESNTRTEIEI